MTSTYTSMLTEELNKIKEELVMRIVKTWCESTQEGIGYLDYNGYNPICRLTKTLWLVKQVGNKMCDIKVVI